MKWLKKLFGSITNNTPSDNSVSPQLGSLEIELNGIMVYPLTKKEAIEPMVQKVLNDWKAENPFVTPEVADQAELMALNKKVELESRCA